MGGPGGGGGAARRKGEDGVLSGRRGGGSPAPPTAAGESRDGREPGVESYSFVNSISRIIFSLVMVRMFG